MIVRPQALELLAKHRTSEAVVTTMSAAHEWPAFSSNDSLDFASRSVMGQAASVGLGVALARPDKKVWVLNGDGSQLMYLGSIASIANADVKNIVLFVFENGEYELTGGQPIPLVGRVDLAMVARGLGFRNSYCFDDLADFEEKLSGILNDEGPVFVTLKVVSGQAARFPMPKMPQEARKFTQGLANSR